MFTGIIEHTGAINEILTTGTNKSFWVSSPLAGDLKIDQSLSHNGVCLTIDEIEKMDTDKCTEINPLDLRKYTQILPCFGSVSGKRKCPSRLRRDGHFS